MALFIEVKVAGRVVNDPEAVGKLSEVCPVNIFARGEKGQLEIIEANLDECTLCELCLAVGAPDDVQVLKLYDGGRALERSA